MGRRRREFDHPPIPTTNPPPYLFTLHYGEEAINQYLDFIAEGRCLIEPLKEYAQGLTTTQARMDISSYVLPGIGPIRAIYYRELVLEQYYYNILSGTQLSNTSFFCHNGRTRKPDNWLAYDMFLTTLLNQLGVTWEALEETIINAFWEVSLPKAFIKAQKEGDPSYTLTLWQAIETEPSGSGWDYHY